MKKIINRIIYGITTILFVTTSMVSPVFADFGISVSPMDEKIILSPGDTYTGSFTVFNQAQNKDTLSYEAEVIPFYANERYDAVYEETGNYNQMVKWITLEKSSGVLDPNNGANISYTITVPQNAPSGGQYAAIRVTSINADSNTKQDAMGANIDVRYGIAYTIFAEITGTTKRNGEITDVNLPSFLLSGNIMGTSSIKNTGNVHGTAKYTLQVFPLFSEEELFTTEESPSTRTILPERTLYNETVWPDTPPVGIFNVVYTVEFEGVTEQVSKMVIKCPIWLLFLIIFAVIALIIYIVLRAKNKGKKSRKSDD